MEVDYSGLRIIRMLKERNSVWMVQENAMWFDLGHSLPVNLKLDS